MRKFSVDFEHGFIVVIEPEHHARVHHDAVVVKHFDLVFEFSDLVEALVGFGQGILGNRLHAHEDRDAAAVGRQFDHLRIISQEQGGLASHLMLRAFNACHNSRQYAR